MIDFFIESGIYVGDQSVTLEQVGSIIKNRRPGKTEPSVKLKADREVPVGGLVYVMDEVRLSG